MQPLATNTMPEPTSQRIFRLTPEKRQLPRVNISIGGRFMLEDRSEHGGTACEASVQALAIESEAKCRLGERIVGYFYTIGRIEGKVVRLTEKGFIVELATTPLKRDRLANQLTWLANREILNLPEDRRHDRIVPRNPRVEVRNLTQNGPVVTGHVIDISRSGAAISVKAKFSVRDEIVLGTTPAIVVRVFDGGIATEFHAAMPDAMFSVDIRL